MKRTNFNIIGYRRVGYIFSAVLVTASILALAIWGLRLGIDFTGGSLIEIKYNDQRPALEEIQQSVPESFGSAQVTPVGENGYVIRLMSLTEEQHQAVLETLPGADTESFIEERFTSIGPTIGVELRNKAIYALAAVLVAILLYVAWAFRKVSHPVPSWQYGAAAIAALFHDVIITLGIFAVLGNFLNVEIGTLFITALLTVLGFSVHDTIVVFDRVRDNLHRMDDRFPKVVNTSLNETMSRSINTSFTTLLVLLFSLFFGGSSITFFVLALVIGIVFGTYSSIFIASPLLVSLFVWQEKRVLGK